MYENSSWDLVDALKEKEESITSIKEEYLPQEMKGMSLAEKENYVKKKAEERKKIQKEIAIIINVVILLCSRNDFMMFC